MNPSLVFLMFATEEKEKKRKKKSKTMGWRGRVRYGGGRGGKAGGGIWRDYIYPTVLIDYSYIHGGGSE